MFNLEEELKKLPAKPGVYMMIDEHDEVIYVGKAISLKNRVRQYFQDSRGKSPKILKMVSHIARFTYTITDSELEALILECNLIKEYRPKYNTMLMDDKAYPFIRVTLEEDYPRMMFSRTQKRDKSRYFGPYTSAGAVKDTLKLLHKLYKLRTCTHSLPADIGKDRPCLNYQIHQCDAPCQGYISKEEYRKNVDAAMDFLGGKYDTVLKDLERQMKAAAAEWRFEEAGAIKELYQSVQKVAQKQKITGNHGEEKDVIACHLEGNDAVVQSFFIREGKMIGRDDFHMTIDRDETPAQVLNGFVKQFYAGTPYIPVEIHLPVEIEDREIIETWLSERKGRRVNIKVPQRGEKAAMVELAAKNAKMVWERDQDKLKREEERTVLAAASIAELLGLSDIHRMEAFDISNISGCESVGSMVVFEDGKPRKSDYRRFRIRTVVGPDDYASMLEVLTRRFKHGLREREELRRESSERGELHRGDGEPAEVANGRAGQTADEYAGSFVRFPDLILMDGGKGQVTMAKRALKECGIFIPVCGMVKDDFHRTRALYYEGEELEIDPRSEGFKLITRIQDEAHRFAITYHRNLRSKDQIHSVLDDIEGIGPVRRKALMRTFGDVEHIRQASVEELAAVPEMNRSAAEKVAEFFGKFRKERD